MIHINLLPPEQKKKLLAQAVARRWRSATVLVFLAAIIANGALWATGMWLAQQEQQYATQVEELQTNTQESRLGEVNKKIVKVNTLIEPLGKILPTARDWSLEINRFLAELPPNVTISEFQLSRGGELKIQGTAATRSDFLVLDEYLKNHPLLKNVTTESLAGTREQLPFEYFATLVQSE